MRARAHAHDVGVALNEAHAVERNAEPFDDHLRERCLVPLPARLRAERDINPALGQHLD